MSRRIEVAAYYFPNYHRDARNDAWHGAGWTEWDLVRAARPRFAGHRQPIVPAWGHFDEADPAWAAREIDLAADHGVTSFLYDWYWYEDGPYLGGQLEEGFLQAPNRDRLRFGIHWANHDWRNIHPADFQNQPALLAPGAVSRAAWERLTDHVVARYFPQPNYLTIGGCPYFSIYDLGTFVNGLGGIEGAAQAIASFRAKTRAAGFPDLHLNCPVWMHAVLAGESKPDGADQGEALARLGMASVTSYAWVQHYDLNLGGFPRGSYAAAAEENYRVWDRYRANLTLPYHPNVSMGWDPSPRTVQSDAYEKRGYPWTAILDGNTPQAFQAALARAKEYLLAGSDEHPLVTINAWNEWTEGSYLLPDTVTGTAYLDAVRSVFGVASARAAAAR